MPTHKSAREILEDLFILGMNYEDDYWRTPENMKDISKTLAQLAELVRSYSPKCTFKKCEDCMLMNPETCPVKVEKNTYEHIAQKLEGKK
jgi:hypothetical protein